jgi:hypothetical protein
VFEKIEKDNIYSPLLTTMDDLIKHSDSSFGILKNELKKLNTFFSHIFAVQPLDDIQSVFDKMKDSLISIKDQLQTRISLGSIDLCAAWEPSLSFVNLYSQESVSIRELVSDRISEAIDFYLEGLNFRSETSFLKNRLIGIKRMVNFDNLDGIIQSLCQLAPLVDIYFSECRLNLGWTDEAISQFKTSVREMFTSGLHSLTENGVPLSVPGNETFDLYSTIEACLSKLLVPDTSDSDRNTIESYMAFTFTISDFIHAKQGDPNHPIFSSRLTGWFKSD